MSGERTDAYIDVMQEWCGSLRVMRAIYVSNSYSVWVKSSLRLSGPKLGRLLDKCTVIHLREQLLILPILMVNYEEYADKLISVNDSG